jgi:hypothetical protein
MEEKIKFATGLTAKERDALLKLVHSGHSKEEIVDYGVKVFSLNIVGILSE